MLVCLSEGMCDNKVIPKETKKEVEEMGEEPTLALHLPQDSGASIRSRGDFLLFCIPFSFPLPPKSSRCHFSLLSKCTVLSQPFVLSLSLSLYPSQAIRGIFSDKTHQTLRLKLACLHTTQNEQLKFKGFICCQLQKTLTEVTEPCLRGYQNN